MWTYATSAAAAALLLVSCASTATAPAPARTETASLSPAAEVGRGIAQDRCAGCHAIDASRESPRSAAPPFVVLRDRYLATSLQRRLEAMRDTEHSQMPPLLVHWDEIQALYAYMESLPRGEKP